MTALIKISKNLFLPIFFLCFLFLTNSMAQTSELQPKLDLISKNNFAVKIFEGNIFYGQEGDAIRVAGNANKGDIITVFVNGDEYRASMDKYNNWFVLFSITNFTEREYIIEAQTMKDGVSGERVQLATLKIGEEPIEIEEQQDKEEKDIKKIDFKDVLLIIISATLIVSLSFILFPKLKISKGKIRTYVRKIKKLGNKKKK